MSGPDLARHGLLIPKDIPGSFCEFRLFCLTTGAPNRARRIAVHVVGTVIAHIAKTAMYAPPGIGSSRLPASFLEAADETREGRKGPPLRARSKRGQRLSPLGALVRQNNQNSQNEPGMSFEINEPYRARSGPDMVAGGFRRLIEGGLS